MAVFLPGMNPKRSCVRYAMNAGSGSHITRGHLENETSNLPLTAPLAAGWTLKLEHLVHRTIGKTVGVIA
jgi:hypothetical protein